MSAPMTPSQLVAAYKRWGLTVREVTRHGTSWRVHSRPGSWQSHRGQIAHHTGPYGSVEGIVAMLFDGRPDLAGPLCTNGIGPDGLVWMVGGGRANHAGAGAANVFAALGRGRTPGAPGPDAIDGNAVLYGDEVMNPGDGKTPYPNAQVEALIRVHAARAEHHGWSGAASIRHGGWTTRKIDMRGHSVHGDEMTQAFLQHEVDRALALGPSAYTYPARSLEDTLAKLDSDDLTNIRTIVEQALASHDNAPLGRSGPLVGGKPLTHAQALQEAGIAGYKSNHPA